jgi:2-polyprenyl-6-methoxyphenol hydroxylase-like FAD-dependent oxidoreductase
MKILVVGAGIAGLTFVRVLRRFQPFYHSLIESIDIVERSASFKEGVGIVLHPNGLRILDRIGLSEQISSRAKTIEAMATTRPNGQDNINLAEVWGLGNLSKAIHRKDLHDILVSDLRSSGNTPVTIRMGCPLKDIVTNSNETKAQFEGGRMETFDLVIGADGVHSTLRKSMFPGSDPESTNVFFIRFLAEDVPGLQDAVWTIFQEEKVTFGFIPLPDNRVHCFVQQYSAEAPCKPGEEETYLKRCVIPDRTLLAEALSRRTGQIQSGFAYMVPPRHWSRNNCVFIGDAAHAVSPTLSEGGSLAIEDAFVLALALGHSRSITVAIQEYRKLREEKCLRAYRIAASQLNAIRNNQKAIDQPRNTDSTKLMAGMFSPFLQDPLSPGLQSFFTMITANQSLTV